MDDYDGGLGAISASVARAISSTAPCSRAAFVRWYGVPGGKLIIAMELRETQMINHGGKLVWNAGHVTMPNLDRLIVELKKLYP